MAARASGRGSRYGIDGAILETSLGSIGTVLETATPEAGRRKPEVWNVAFGAGTIEPRAAGTQAGFPRRRTPGEAAGGPGIDSQLCARCRSAPVADGDAEKVPVETRSRAAAEPSGVPAGRGPYQVVQLRLGSAGRQCTTHAQSAGSGRNQPGSSGCFGRSEVTRHARPIV